MTDLQDRLERLAGTRGVFLYLGLCPFYYYINERVWILWQFKIIILAIILHIIKKDRPTAEAVSKRTRCIHIGSLKLGKWD